MINTPNQKTRKSLLRIQKSILPILKKNNVLKAGIFGSFARGKAKENSDIDLILISRKFMGKKMFERPVGLHFHWKMDLPIDFLCYTPKEFNKLKNKVSIARDALLEGIEIK